MQELYDERFQYNMMQIMTCICHKQLTINTFYKPNKRNHQFTADTCIKPHHRIVDRPH